MLPNVTVVQMAEAIFKHTKDQAWLSAQLPYLRSVTDWMVKQVTPEGLVRGGGFYVERPPRLDHDGVTQCYTADALRLAARADR